MSRKHILAVTLAATVLFLMPNMAAAAKGGPNLGSAAIQHVSISYVTPNLVVVPDTELVQAGYDVVEWTADGTCSAACTPPATSYKIVIPNSTLFPGGWTSAPTAIGASVTSPVVSKDASPGDMVKYTVEVYNGGPSPCKSLDPWLKVYEPSDYPGTPSLTLYGVLALVLLLAAAGIWMYRKKAAGAAA